MSSESVDPGHGHSPAAWTAVIIIVAFFFDAPIVVWASAGLAVIGLIVGWIMKRAGYGVGGSKYQPKGH